MKRIICIICLFLLIINGNNAQKIVSIEREFPINWVADIGNVSYRTNLIVADNNLLIGSNGDNFRDYAIDKGNGLKVLDPEKGKIKMVILGESYGDVDVNGVKIHDNKIYFGNDNDEFVCADIKGDILWRLPVSGDVEHEPIVLNCKGKKLIVFATESGELRAVEPENGNTVWEHLHPEFKGWRQGSNRYVFKIKTHFRSGRIFFSKPAEVDLNLDGVTDLVYSCNFDEIRAINGANGKLLWTIKNNDTDKWSLASNYHDTPIMVGKGNRIKILVPKHKYNNGDWNYKLSAYDRKGKILKDYHYRTSVGSKGLNSLNVSVDRVVIPFKNSLAVFDVNNEKIDFINGLNLKYTYNDWQNKQQIGDRFSYDPLLGNQLIEYKNEACVVMLYQRDYAKEKPKAVVCIVGLSSQKVHDRFHLPSGSEFAPHISDVNKDGKLDLLVGCYDGKLYCYNMGISSRNLLTEEKKYSITASDIKQEVINTATKTSITKNAIDNDEKEESIEALSSNKLSELKDFNNQIEAEEGLSVANVYLLSYASFALLVFVGASIYLYRKEEESMIDQA